MGVVARRRWVVWRTSASPPGAWRAGVVAALVQDEARNSAGWNAMLRLMPPLRLVSTGTLTFPVSPILAVELLARGQTPPS